jgi:tRNA(Leu) C34 or U34 (ribose-2'-O)-methylase TrmL
MRGYACVGLDNPKFDSNVGGVLRACGVFGAAMVCVASPRFKVWPTDTMKAHLHLPLLLTEDVLSCLPRDCVPVAVDIIDGATPLPEYTHPERAMYIFGAEDSTLDREMIERCRDVVSIPSRQCLNLAATVNVVLYDRMAKGESR